MELDTSSSRRGRLVRTVLAVVLSVVAVDSLRKGNRLRGALAGVGALALGYATRSPEPTRRFELGTDDERESTEVDDEDAELRCAICGEPIRPGQSRGPNEDDEIVHDACRM